MGCLRILVADDHELVRRGIRVLLENHPGWEVSAEAKDGREAVERANELKPDLVLMDIGMPNLNGIDAARQILANSPATHLLILTMHYSQQVVQEVLAVGARGFLLKSDAVDASHGVGLGTTTIQKKTRGAAEQAGHLQHIPAAGQSMNWEAHRCVGGRVCFAKREIVAHQR